MLSCHRRSGRKVKLRFAVPLPPEAIAAVTAKLVKATGFSIE